MNLNERGPAMKLYASLSTARIGDSDKQSTHRPISISIMRYANKVQKKTTSCFWPTAVHFFVAFH